MKGKKRGPMSEEHKRKLSIAHTGVPLSEEHRRKIGLGRKGKTLSEETKRKMSKNHGRYWKGKTMSKEARRNMSLGHGGDGVLDKVWDNVKLRQWTKAVKERDNHTCQYCEATENLEAHHVFPKSRFPALAYDLNNGRTLCQSCHIEEHKLYYTDCFQDILQAFSDFA